MALTGIQIYKLLPKTNCKECGYPTCMAFAMKLAAGQEDLSKCPYASDEAKQQLAAAAKPPMRAVTIGTGDHQLTIGGELVMYRHEKKFFNPAPLMVRVKDTASADDINKTVEEVGNYSVDRVGMTFTFDGFAIQNDSGDASKFASCVESVKSKTEMPLVLISTDPDSMSAALEKAGNDRPVIYAATKDNIDQMTELAKKYSCPLVVKSSNGLEELADLSGKASGAGVEDLILDPGDRDFHGSLTAFTQMRRLAFRKFEPFGYPIISFPGEGASSVEEEVNLAGQHIAKYSNIVVMDSFSPAIAYTLLTLRLNVYTDPQKPIQLQAGLYQVGTPDEKSPLCITTNYALSYFAISGEVEATGRPAWIMVVDTEGLSVLTAWSAGKFDADGIAAHIKQYDAGDKINHNSLILPGGVAILKGETEENLPDWKILVGPREAAGIGGYFKQNAQIWEG
ncbi:MAG: acetyl-CoA decarbonylase/synthase complex subunit gamma [Dehalococcoidia bacterium]